MRLLHCITLGSALFAASVAIAQEAAPEQDPAVIARKSQFRLFAHHLGTMGNMARGTTEYDAELAAAAARNLSLVASQDQATFWPSGTDTESIEGTRALPVIWDNMDEFASRLENLRTAASRMEDVAGTDLASLQGRMKEVSDACGACHRDFRQPE